MALPNEKELDLIKKFRNMTADLNLNEEQQSDMYLVAWLRARDLDLKKANEMLRTSLEWRKAHEIDTVLEWTPPQEYVREYSWNILGGDKEGCPVGLIPFGIWDVRKAFESGKKDIWLKYIDRLFATMFKEIKDRAAALNKPLTQMTVIFDFNGFSMRQLTSFGSVDSVLEVVRRFEANYPETLKDAIVINAPFIFSLLFSLVKPLLSARTLSKVTIYGSNEGKWKQALLKLINPDQLPVQLGGTNTSVCTANTILQESSNDPNDNEDLVAIHVEAGQKVELEYDIPEPNTRLMWTFKPENYDIGFSIVFNDKAEVYPYQRYNAATEGTITCERAGKYMMIFDNSYSKLRRKAIHYMVTTSSPESVLAAPTQIQIEAS